MIKNVGKSGLFMLPIMADANKTSDDSENRKDCYIDCYIERRKFNTSNSSIVEES